MYNIIILLKNEEATDKISFSENYIVNTYCKTAFKKKHQDV